MSDLRQLLEDLAGHPPPLPIELPARLESLLADKGDGIGYSQFNELMLILGYNRVSSAFFQFLADGETVYLPGTSLKSIEQLRAGARRVRELSLLFFGNLKFGFKILSRDADSLRLYTGLIDPRPAESFETRHSAIRPIEEIPADQTYYLGYMIEAALLNWLKENPDDQDAKKERERRKQIVSVGLQNQISYLASDHLDVYVATSMRERHEYVAVSRFTKDLFGSKALSGLRLRWFDPTQAFCENRIDKGLAEALMLKRAKCTIYLAQETDTLGKDSELASTLAQGKTVVAFVPQVEGLDVDQYLAEIAASYPDLDERSVLLNQLRFFEPSAAWLDKDVSSWVSRPQEMDLKEAKARLAKQMKAHYDKRFKMLKEDHPLGIQVNLESGVANGVLVVRTIDECAELVRRVITRSLEFDVAEISEKGGEFCVLRERVSGCIYRLMTRDAMLTNAFWNFYLNPSE